MKEKWTQVRTNKLEATNTTNPVKIANIVKNIAQKVFVKFLVDSTFRVARL